ncbi:hypothetical protein ABPG75_013380 [Micractinium tetrahymenae]
MAQEERFRVFVRVRPLRNGEQNGGLQCGTNSVTAAGGQELGFSGVLPPDASQQQLFDHVGAQIVDHVIDGFDACIMAYGGTGSGKTHSMLGDAGAGQPGLVPLAMRRLAALLDPGAAGAGSGGSSAGQLVAWEVQCSAVEIYKEACTDLLPPRKEFKKERAINWGMLQQQRVRSEAELMRLLSGVMAQRRTAATAANEQSSRSHLIIALALTCTRRCLAAGGAVEDRQTTSRLHLADLAGSETADQSGQDAARKQEAAAINLSLSALKRVVPALARGDAHVPYRDSKLTLLLQDALSGNSKAVLLAAVSPAAQASSVTSSTLSFATTVRGLRITASRNQARTSKVEVERLQQQLAQARQELEDRRQLEQEAEQLRRQLEQTQQELAPLRQAAAEVQEEHAALQAQLAELLQQIDEARHLAAAADASFNAQKGEVLSLQAQLSAAQQEAARQVDAVAAQKEEAGRLAGQLAAAEEEAARQAAAASEAREEVRNLHNRLAAAAEQAAAGSAAGTAEPGMQEQLVAAQEEAARQAAAAQAAAEDACRLQERLAAAEKEAARLRQQLADQEQAAHRYGAAAAQAAPAAEAEDEGHQSSDGEGASLAARLSERLPAAQREERIRQLEH